MHNQEGIKGDLIKLGIKQGDTLFLRVSYKAIGKIEGGPKAFLDALLSVVGSEGTIIMTAFPTKYITQLRFFFRKHVYSKDHLPKPITGVMPVMALTIPDVKISEKLEFPFVAIGQHADYLTKNHTHDKSGYWLLREAIEKFDCKCLRIGGKAFLGSTHIVIEDIFKQQCAYMSKLRYGLYLNENKKVRWFDDPNITFCIKSYASFTDRISNVSKLHEGFVGDGYAIITSMKASYNEEMKIYSENIKNLLCDDPNCLICRTSYSFSDSNNIRFMLHQIKRLFSKQFKEALVSIRDVMLKMLFAKKTYL